MRGTQCGQDIMTKHSAVLDANLKAFGLPPRSTGRARHDNLRIETLAHAQQLFAGPL